MSSVEIKNLTKVFGEGHTAVKAVDGINLSVAEGEIVLIMGPSGSGKTTLISIAGALLKPTSGTVSIAGEVITSLSETKLPNIRLKEIGFIFQSFNLLSSLTAVENVTIPLVAAGVKRKDALAKAKVPLSKLGLSERLNNLPRNLSGGEKQRVAVARALINNPKLILADEPTANLDTKNGHEVMELLCGTACMEGRTVIIVSHDARIKDFAHRVLWIEDGKITKEEVGRHNQTCKMRDHSKEEK